MANPTCRVLLVEDDPEERMLFAAAVNRAGVPWSLRIASGRQEAIDAINTPSTALDGDTWSEPDLVVLDVRLGVTSGFHVLRWIRTNLRERNTPVVIFSSSVEPGIREQAQEYGGTVFVQKPSTLDGEIRVVRQLYADWCGSSRTNEGQSSSVAREEDASDRP